MCAAVSCVAGCCGGRSGVGGGPVEVSVVTGNLDKFPRESAEVPSFAVNEGIGGLGALLHFVDQLVLRCM